MTIYSFHRFEYYCKSVLSSDLLLKLNDKNKLKIPKLKKIRISSQKVPFEQIKNASLALESLTGQKVFSVLQETTDSKFKYGKKDQNTGNFRTSNYQPNVVSLSCSLLNQQMYRFLEKLFPILLVCPEYKNRIQNENIQLILTNREIRQFPEIQNHFDLFDFLQTLEIQLMSSAKNEKETFLLWQGLHQKEF